MDAAHIDLILGIAVEAVYILIVLVIKKLRKND